MVKTNAIQNGRKALVPALFNLVALLKRGW